MTGSDRVEVFFCECVTGQLKKMHKRDPERLARVEGAIDRARDLGWQQCLQVKLIKMFRDADGPIGEIRYMGKGAQRLIFFATESAADESLRELYITDILPKSVLKPNRLNAVIRRAAEIWREWTSTGAC